MRGALLALALLVWCSTTALAQQLQVRLFNESSGLGNPTIQAFAQEADGHLWIATENGIFRYDGAAFTEYGRNLGLTDPTVYGLLIDHTGTLWAGTHHGLFRFNGHSFEQLRLGHEPVRVGMNSMLAATSAGELIVETTQGLLSAERSGAQNGWSLVRYEQRHPGFPASTDMDGIAVDGTGQLWFGCEAALCRFNGRTRKVLGPAQGVPHDIYASLFVTREGLLWARGRKHILTWRPDDPEVRENTALFPRNAIGTVNRRFVEDAWGALLTPTARGFARWDGRSWTETDSTSKGLLDGVTDLFSDREGSLWIGTEGEGLLETRGYGGNWRSYGVEQGLRSGKVSTIAEDARGSLWFGHDIGVDKLLHGASTITATPFGHRAEQGGVVGLAPTPDGGMWLATALGHVYRLKRDGRIAAHGAIDCYINHVVLDDAGVLWLSTSEGLYTARMQPGGGVTLAPLASLGEQEINDVAAGTGGAVWVASSRGLDLLRGGKLTHIAVAGQRGGLLLVTASRDGSLWLESDTATVLHARVVGAVAKVFKTYSRPELASDLIEFIEEDARGRLWIGTDHGVNVVENGQVFRLGEEDGLIADSCMGDTFWADRNGSVWIGTSRGVSHLLAPERALHRKPFAASIELSRYNGHSFAPGQTMPWTGGPLLLRFSGLTLRDNASMIYRYRLAGLSNEVTSTTIPSALFHALKPGRYTLSVVAEDAGHRRVSTPAQVSFRITPPWWRTTDFYLLEGVLGVGFLVAICQWRHVALLSQRQRLQRLVEERTRDLEQLAIHDGLTGLLNRTAILDVLREQLESSGGRRKDDLCIALVDLDHFKLINDTYGHLAGDEVLREAARRLKGAVRAGDKAGRYGGEEFLIMLKGCTRDQGLQRCEQLRITLSERPICWEDYELPVTCSVGAAWSLEATDSLTTLLAHADRALYRAKEQGRNRVMVADETDGNEEDGPVSHLPLTFG